jgi:hypothetical protein
MCGELQQATLATTGRQGARIVKAGSIVGPGESFAGFCPGIGAIPLQNNAQLLEIGPQNTYIWVSSGA